MPNLSQLERLATLEAQLRAVASTVEKISDKQDEIHAVMLQAQGAAKAGRWIGHGFTAFIAFAVSQFGGALHLPLPR
jgi:hypothetical protein